MEVHHHPEVGHKSFKEYLLEGLMIFVAVTLGFFAESLREHLHDNSKKHEYMVSLAQDLRADTAATHYSVSVETMLLAKCDTLLELMLNPPTDPLHILKTYQLVWATMDAEDVNYDNRTYDALKSSGDMRLLQTEPVLDSLQQYVHYTLEAQDQDEFVHRQLEVMSDAGNRIFIARQRFKRTAPGDFRFATSDSVMFNEYCGRLGFYMGVVQAYVRQLHRQDKRARNLLKLLHTEYDID